MFEKNHAVIGQAMNFILLPMLRGFVAKNLIDYFGENNWWQDGVLKRLHEDQKKNLPLDGAYGELTDKLDVQLCLLLIDIHWQNIFSRELPYSHFNYIKELKMFRNLWAHDPNAFNDDETDRAINTMILVSKKFDTETADELQKILDKRHGKKEPEEILPPTNKILKSWREIIEPNSDVAAGRYRQAEFAADLGQVVRGEGSSEYTNPKEFFSRTYLTSGLKTLLVETLKRLTLGDGEPIIQLKTSFGGGKTHSLLALYHLFGGKIRAENSPAVMEILNAAEISSLPKVHTAVIVGTWENPLKSTLWGEIAAQLSKSTGNPELYEMIRENDENKISPGVELLRKIFDAAGSCLILIDELVAYGRKLQLKKVKDGGTFGNLMSFIQELTEAAKASKKSAVVVSIPESDAEIIDNLGRRVLQQTEKFFGRVEFVWSPITNVEGYEIVRRRLFKPCQDEEGRQKVCQAFFDMYVENSNDFPYESRKNNYLEKLLSCYPIHPKLFDFLYDKWTSLEKFQKTRGVLRLMASVIYYLWKNNDDGAMIMPGNIPINFSPVQDELTKLLGGNWDAIINAEVDGKRSKPQEIDNQNPRFKRLTAGRKISRTIFMGTAPGSRQGEVRGVLENEIRLGVIQPSEVESIAVYNDVLTKLKANLYYLYSQGTRLWFGVNPTLRKLFDDKREQYSDDDIEYAIEEKLKKWKERGAFQAVHICPKFSSDVPDEQTARLVILSPKYFYGSAFDATQEILENRGTIPRRWKNMLVFMSADEEKLRVLKDVVRDFLAWSEVLKEMRTYNLDILQKEDAENNLKTAKENFSMKLSQAYCKIFVPEKAEDGNLNRPLHILEIDCIKENNISAASEKIIHDEVLLLSLGAITLKNSLDKFIWRDDDSVKINQLWEYFATYYYLPRLLNENVLIDAVRKGVEKKIFAVAEDFQNGEYTGLKFGEKIFDSIPTNYLLVKAEVAEKFFKPEIETPPEIISPTPSPPDPTPKPEIKPLPKNFSMDVELDKVRYAREIKIFMEEIISHMMNLPDAETSIHLSIKIAIPEGVSDDVKDLVEANCSYLKIGKENFHFE